MAIDHFPPPGPFPAEKAIWVETILNVCEGEKLKIDGFFEPAPWAAIKSFQQRNSLPVTGGFDNRTLVALTQRALNVIQGSVLPIGGGVMAELAVAVIQGSPLPVHGVMDERTVAEIIRFQSSSNLLRKDGIVDRDTRAAMVAALNTRAGTSPITKVSFDVDKSQEMQPVRSGNLVIGLIDGREAFSSMVDAIATAKNNTHYIYMLNWSLDLRFELIPGKRPAGGARSTRLGDLLSNAVSKGVQVRAMLWDNIAPGYLMDTRQSNKFTNSLADGAAILDSNTLKSPRHLITGSHHQKIWIVKGEQGLIGFCGGIDFYPDRIMVVKTGPLGTGSVFGSGSGKGSPQHDVHCRIQGPAAWDLLKIFIERWIDHPDTSNIDIKKGNLRGLGEPIPSSVGNMQVQIGRTYGNGSAHAGIRNKSGQKFYSFAPRGERTAERLIFRAIRQAQSFIYMEDQYLISMAASNVLRAQLPKIQFLIILIGHSSITDLPRVWELRKRFIDNLRSDPATRHKVVICYRKPAGVRPDPKKVDPDAPHTYVHAKMFIFDDSFAIIGSANCNNRGYNHDSEVIAGILDDVKSDKNFAKELRIRLWQHHLNLGRSDVIDPLTSARHWFSPAKSSSVGVYDQNADRDSIFNLLNESQIDPFGG